MHSINGSWAGQAFAVASSNDAGGKKSRIRRSKEERKGMIEYFIKKYQNMNEGNFPSLNLTHKEVGGSFYTVREIVREIIQENRVLAPPKVSFKEYDDSGFLEHHPLGSISTEPQSDLITDAIHTIPIQNPITSEDHNLNYSMQFHEPDSLELDNEQFLNGVSKGIDDSAPNHHQHTSMEDHNSIHQFVMHKSEEFGNEITVNGDKTKESGRQISLDPIIMEVMDREKDGDNSVECVRSDVVVETFPLRPVSSTIVDMNTGSNQLHEAAIALEDDATQHEKVTFDQNSVDLVNQTDDVKDHGTKDPLPDGTKIDSSFKQLTSDDGSLPKGSNPTLDRINLGTWEGVSKNSPRRDNNLILAIVKAFVSAFMKFWTE